MTKSQYCLPTKISLLTLFVLICLPIAGLAQSRGIIKHITFKDASMSNVLTTLGKQMDVEIVIDDSVKNSKMSLELEDVTIDAALQAILAQKHLRGRLLDDKKAIIFSDDEVNRQRFGQFKAWPEAVPASQDQGKLVDDIRQNVAFKDASVKAALATMGKQLKLNVVFDDSVRENRINIELSDVTLKAAMKIIFVQQHLKACLIEDKTILIFPDNETIRRTYYEKYKVWPDDTEKK